MGAKAVLDRAAELGITLRVEGVNIRYKPKEAAPPDFVEALREHKAEVITELTAKPPIPPAPEDPVAEAREIARRVTEYGVCLVWAETVKDFLAFVRDESMVAQVPPGFVVYTDAELRQLFGKGHRYNPAALRLIHETKKQGGKVRDTKPIPEKGNNDEA